jgi:putative acetyltransferase
MSSYDRLRAALAWRPIPGCPGRLVLRPAGSRARDQDAAIWALLGPQVAVRVFRSRAAADPVVVARLEGGALLSYRKPDGSHVHTLNTPAGLARKLAQLGIDLDRTPSVAQVASADELQQMRELFREYQRYLGVDLCFQGFEDELRGLPGRYAPPAGALLLAREGEQVTGGVGLRPLNEAEGICEMKRLYVRPAWRGRGHGRTLAEAVVEQARRAGYVVMRLDSLRRLEEALALYRTMGFREVAPYCHNPLEDVVYMELELELAPVR